MKTIITLQGLKVNRLRDAKLDQRDIEELLSVQCVFSFSSDYFVTIVQDYPDNHFCFNFRQMPWLRKIGAIFLHRENEKRGMYEHYTALEILFSCLMSPIISYKVFMQRVAETLDAEVKRWSSGKQGNLRALLSTLQYVRFSFHTSYISIQHHQCSSLSRLLFLNSC